MHTVYVHLQDDDVSEEECQPFLICLVVFTLKNIIFIHFLKVHSRNQLSALKLSQNVMKQTYKTGKKRYIIRNSRKKT